jgi:CubicO group peptidase (beta-lactamase class C family)
MNLAHCRRLPHSSPRFLEKGSSGKWGDWWRVRSAGGEGFQRRALLMTVAGAVFLGCAGLEYSCLWGDESSQVPTRLPVTLPEEARLRGEHLRWIDTVVEEAMRQGRMPGCVVAIGHRGRIGWLKAYGNRQTEPEPVPMTVNTVFDLASLTKPIATATSVMQLIERGQVRLRDRVADHIPEFGQEGKEGISVEQLLIHMSGLIADNPLSDYLDGEELAFQRIWKLKPQADPGARFIYSDVNYIVLAELVRRVSGKDIHRFTQENLFGPLGMRETGFLPEENLRRRAAPTQQRNDQWMQGEVHDPRAYELGGIAGHAGLFSTAEDLAVYAQMMLDQGTYGGKRVLSPAMVDAMTRSYPVSSGQRGLGWDKQTGFSSNRGELMSERAFGHGGFTGTGIWIDPEHQLFVIFLSNRVHPDGKGLVNPLIGRIGTIAVASITSTP